MNWAEGDMLQKQCLKKIEPNMGIPVICVLLSRMRMDVIPLRNVGTYFGMIIEKLFLSKQKTGSKQ